MTTEATVFKVAFKRLKTELLFYNKPLQNKMIKTDIFLGNCQSNTRIKADKCLSLINCANLTPITDGKEVGVSKEFTTIANFVD